MTNIFVLIARRTVAALFPSVPYADRARVLAAMEGRSLTPAPGLRGEAQPGAGDDLVGGAEAGGTSAPPAGRRIPPVEDLRNWRPDARHRWEFHDRHLAEVVDRWKQATS